MMIISKYRQGDIMKPRVFVSSTFYDLKYIREDLSNFIRAHDFEPIMFEDGDIGYTPGKDLDSSCYETMKNSDMVVLVIGGNYGSAASGETDDFSEFLSVTRKEFRTAKDSKIPIYVFIDSKILAEYDTFDLNQEKLKKDPQAIRFKNTKNINVFYFIKEIYQLGKLPVTSFSRCEEIKNFLSKQWADMFKKYLQILKDEQINEVLNGSIERMDILLNQMKLMVNKIGEKTIDKDELNSVIDEQNKIKVEKVANTIADGISLELTEEDIKNTEYNIEALIKAIEDLIEAIDGNLYGLDMFDTLKRNGISPHYGECSTFPFYSELTKEVIKDEKCREYLKELLINKYYKKIFATSIKELDPDFIEK